MYQVVPPAAQHTQTYRDKTLRNMHEAACLLQEDVQAHNLEDRFKTELQQIHDCDKGANSDKMYDTEELVDLEMAKKLHSTFEMVSYFPLQGLAC